MHGEGESWLGIGQLGRMDQQRIRAAWGGEQQPPLPLQGHHQAHIPIGQSQLGKVALAEHGGAQRPLLWAACHGFSQQFPVNGIHPPAPPAKGSEHQQPIEVCQQGLGLSPIAGVAALASLLELMLVVFQPLHQRKRQLPRWSRQPAQVVAGGELGQLGGGGFRQ